MKKLFKIGWLLILVGGIVLAVGYFNHGNRAIYIANGRPAVVRRHARKLSNNGKFERVDITATTANVIISQGDQYQISYYGTGHVPTATVHNNVASIRQQGGAVMHFVLFDYPSTSQDLIVITVPRDQALAGRIRLESGNLTVKNISLDNADVDVEDGDVNYQQVTLRNGNTKLISGDFTGDNLTIQGHYTVNNESGDNTVTATTTDGYFLKTTDGENDLNGEDKGSTTLHQNDQAANVLSLITKAGDNQIN